MKILNKTLKEYFALENEERAKYDFFIKYGEISPLDVFKVGSLIDSTFGRVKSWQTFFSSESQDWKEFIKLLQESTKVELNAIHGESVFRVVAQMRYLAEEVQSITENENNALAAKEDPIAIAANVARFDKYGAAMQIDKLSRSFNTDYKTIENKPYTECFLRLCIDKDMSEYNIDYQRKQNKSKK